MATHQPLSVLILTPALADANNGNYRTAARWAALLSSDSAVIREVALAKSWQGEQADVVIVLHARRSATSVAAIKAAAPKLPVIVALTGTDLYKDVPAGDADALHSLALSDGLIVLQDDALLHVPELYRHKTRVIFQSSPMPMPAVKNNRLTVIMVGHLRSEKDPLTFLRAIPLIQGDIDFVHIGAGLDPDLAAAANTLMQADSRYRWLGAQAHEHTLQLISQAHLMVISSVMEGGAHVVIEAVNAGTPLIASHMSGNLGMLGADYPGYFVVGDAPGLAATIERFVQPAAWQQLHSACQVRQALFTPHTERERLLAAIQSL
jgi:putative glycosyltransferase (TIGR04348 family)